MKSKHKECSETTQLEPEITVVNAQEIIEEENDIEHAQAHVVDNNTECENKCERCDFTSENKTDLETHMDKNHSDFEIKLEVFVLFVNFDDDVHEVRKKLIAKLEEQDEVEKVEKVFVNKNDAFIDEQNLKWHSVDITLKSKHNSSNWK